jgi:hypothetical protein
VDRYEAVVVCIGYPDFLAQTLPLNIGAVDRVVVVTAESDAETREICRRHDVETFLTEDHKRHDAEFNKGLAIDRALTQMGAGNWRLHLDADIVLPAQFRRMIEGSHLDPRKIYGADRYMVKSYEAWQRLLASGWLSHQQHGINIPPGFTLGARWAEHADGWVPIGFFQLWHALGDEWHGRRIRPYPRAHGTACRADVQHAKQWDRRLRELLPEIVVAHLESENCPNGTNWRGRKTKRFGPAKHQAHERSYMG